MSLKSIPNQVLALAGVYQSCLQVQTIAWKGRYDETLLATAIRSIFKLDAADVEDVFGGKDKVETGLKLLLAQFPPHIPEDSGRDSVDRTRYVLSLLSLQKKLMRQSELLLQIRQSVQQAGTHLDFHGANQSAICHVLAEIYQKTISTLPPRLIINGERVHLSNEDHVAKIRTLLLAGVRSAVLWQQCGGSRLLFLFNRRNYLEEASNLLGTES